MRQVLIVAAVALVALLAFHTVAGITIHLVPHTHDDVGWQVTVDQYYIGSVQYIITTVIEHLQVNPDRKFIYVEQAYFQRWWNEQNEDVKNQVRALVANGQLEFINGGWCMHDEAGTHYIDMIDQTTYGHRFIKEEFGVRPKIGWQIDPFGHSATQAALLSGEVGFEALFFGRIDYQDYNIRSSTKNLEWVWRASPSLGMDSQVFTGMFWKGYCTPADGFNWDIGSNDPPVQDDPRLNDFNVVDKVNEFVAAAQQQAQQFQGENLMWTMGCDFNYAAAHEWFTNLDKIIKAVNADPRGVKAMYSTPSIYVEAKNKENLTWALKTDDIFPYADGDDSYWTGYFTSRPALKRYVRVQSAFLQVARHIDAIVGGNGAALEPLWEALSVAQHHDGVSGTAKQAVTLDYAKRLSVGGAVADAALEAGLATLVTQPNGTRPLFSYCPLANTSICAASAQNQDLVVVLYNMLARARIELVRIPTSAKSVTVMDGNNLPVTSQLILTPQDNPARTADSLPNEIQFYAFVPGLGLATYFVQTNSLPETVNGANDQQEAEIEKHSREHRHLRPVGNPPPPAAPTVTTSTAAATLTTGTRGTAAPTSISNRYWKLDFDSNNLLYQLTRLSTGDVIPFAQNFYWYKSFQVDGQQNSGAYIFRPSDKNDPGTPVVTSASSITTITGAVTSEVQQTFTPWLTQRIRLHNISEAIEFEYTVGPIPVWPDMQGKEIIARYTTNIASNATWYTDSNGREWQKRIRNYRPTWSWNPTQPVAGNYYPVNAGIWLTDSTNGFAVLNDRSQGGSSMKDGQLELMVHRRLTMDDGRGVGEALNETGLDGRGLIISGTHTVLVTPAADLLSTTRQHQARVYAPYHMSLAALTSSIPEYLSTHNPTFSVLQTALPPNIDLTSAYAQADGTILIRLQHNFGVGEGPLAAPVTVNISALTVPPYQLQNGVEVTLTNNALPSDIQRLSWNVRAQEEEVETGGQKVIRQRGIRADNTVTISPAEIRTFVFPG